MESEIYNLNIPYGCPWYNHYREIHLESSPIEKHERLSHVMANLLIVSSENPDPMQEFQKLSGHYRAERKLQNETGSGENPNQLYWFSDSSQILFLLVHDVHNGSEAKAQEVFANLKLRFTK